MDEIDAKLAGIGRRLQAQRSAVRDALAGEPPLLQLAEEARATFGARLVYVRVGDFEQGNRAAFDERGIPYNFDPRLSHVPDGTVRDDFGSAAHVPPNRSGNQPYRGRKAGGKRRVKPPAASGAGRPDPMAWIDRS
jgi:hypothetical protein